MKKLKILITAAVMMTFLCMTAFAGEWKQDRNGWWWQDDDGSYPANCWQWIDDNNDQISECYYFDANGYCLMNTVTPDNCTVNENGGQKRLQPRPTLCPKAVQVPPNARRPAFPRSRMTDIRSSSIQARKNIMCLAVNRSEI